MKKGWPTDRVQCRVCVGDQADFTAFISEARGDYNDKSKGQGQAGLTAVTPALGLYSGLHLDFICLYIYLVTEC